jgi:hypothetical protein
MRRKAVHLIAAIAESLRFFAIAFLAFSVGALFDSSVSSLLRYAAAPQLLFAVGFFFMWLDRDRYASYRPLLAVGKLASAACYIPLASALVRDPWAAAACFGVRGLGLSLALFVAAVDIASLSVLLLARDSLRPAGLAGAEPSDPPKPPLLGQGPGDIERVEA